MENIEKSKNILNETINSLENIKDYNPSMLHRLIESTEKKLEQIKNNCIVDIKKQRQQDYYKNLLVKEKIGFK